MRPEEKLEKEVRFLKAYAVAATACFALLFLTAFQTAQQKQRFTEIDVERINVVQPDGKLALVIANPQRMPGGILKGKELPQKREAGGIIFFNKEGTESGGLIHGGEEKAQGYEAGAIFTFDQFNNDQILYMKYQDDGKSRNAGFHVMDRPVRPNLFDYVQMMQATGEEKARFEKQAQEARDRGEGPAERVFLGSVNRNAVLTLNDTQGRRRIRLYVDKDNVARMEFRNEKDEVIYSLPPEK